MNSELAFSELPNVSTVRPVARAAWRRWSLVAAIVVCAVGIAALYFTRPVPRVDPNAPPVIVEVTGMHCPLQCGLRVESALETLPWVTERSVTADPKAGVVTFTVSDGAAVDEAEIRRVIAGAGFGVGTVKLQ